MIVGIAGRKRSGKSTLGERLVKELGFKQLAFADGVREFAAALFGWDLARLYSDDFKTTLALRVANPGGLAATPMTGRELLQRVGTDAARKVFGDDCWVRAAMAKCVGGPCARCGKNKHDHYVRDLWHCARGDPATLQGAYTPTFNYVITDVRFPNEAHAIKNAGGIVIRLNTAESVKTLHDYVDCVDGECKHAYDKLPVPGAPPQLVQSPGCRLPQNVHPIGWSDDRHESENSLPDVGVYDFTATGSLEENTNAAMLYVLNRRAAQ